MINLKAAVLMVFALVLGTGAAMMAHGWIQDQARVDDGSDNSVQVYVAAREIPYGKRLEPSYVKTVAWPRDALPEGAILANETIEDRFVSQTVLPGEPLLSARVVEKLPGSRLSSIVTPNKRAISVRVNDVAGVAGFLLPGNRVDVLATRMEKRRAITQTLLQNIKVLAVDQKASPDKDEPIVVRAVTLEADLDQAASLANATEEGTIQLVLRNPEDTSTMPLEEPELAAAAPDIPAARQRRLTQPRSVTIIRGTQVVKSRLKH